MGGDFRADLAAAERERALLDAELVSRLYSVVSMGTDWNGHRRPLSTVCRLELVAGCLIATAEPGSEEANRALLEALPDDDLLAALASIGCDAHIRRALALEHGEPVEFGRWELPRDVWRRRGLPGGDRIVVEPDGRVQAREDDFSDATRAV